MSHARPNPASLAFVLALFALPAFAADEVFVPPTQDEVQQQIQETNVKAKPDADGVTFREEDIGKLDVAQWLPQNFATQASPLIIFSHGFGGCNTYYQDITHALAAEGYIVLAPNHKDSHCSDPFPPDSVPDKPFDKPEQWDATTYQARGMDIRVLAATLSANAEWNKRVDWDKVGLMGHSLGGYTVLGVAGARSEWKITGVKAVLALAPYVAPYLTGGGLEGLGIPVMYQAGTADTLLTPPIVAPNGAYERTSAPAYLVVFDGADHFAWTNQAGNHDAIVRYTRLFFDAYVKGVPADGLLEKSAGVTQLDHK